MCAPAGNEVRRKGDGKHCDLCGCAEPSVRCEDCNKQIFCLSCDDMYHRHPKRQAHIRKVNNGLVCLRHWTKLAAWKQQNIKHCFSIWQTLDERFQTFRPPLPPKGNQPAPVPPPRRNKKDMRSSTPSPEIPRMIQEINHMTQVFQNFYFIHFFLFWSPALTHFKADRGKNCGSLKIGKMVYRDSHTFAC